jgi:hypothetical protein
VNSTTDDRFVPVRIEDLVRAIDADTARFGSLAEGVSNVAAGIDAVIDQETTAFHRQLDERYAAFNPDRDTKIQGSLETKRSAEDYEAMVAHLDYVLGKANFEHLDAIGVDAAIRTASSYGVTVRVRPEAVQRLRLYVRGRGTVEQRHKTWRHPIAGVTRQVEVFRRLAMVVQLRDSPHLLLKLFREIPIRDVEALLPHAEIEMSFVDRLKVIGGGAGALGGLATKLFTVLVGGAVAATQMLWVLIVAAFGVSVRSFFGYQSTKQARSAQMAHNLYYQNVANNVGVLHTLLTMIAQEELKEALLAYVFLVSAKEAPADVRELDGWIEDWLRERFGVEVNYDCPDAIETLDRLGLWADRDALKIQPTEVALERLEAHWRERRSAGYHRDVMAEGDPMLPK